MRKIAILWTIGVMFGVFLLAGGASALTLRLDDPLTPGIDVIVSDNGPGDINLALGAITYFGAIGNWSLNVTTGISKPIIGGPSVASMDLNSVNVLSAGAGTLIISLSDAGFTLPFSPVTDIMAIGGTTNGIVTYAKWIGTEEFDKTTFIGTLGPFGPVAFSGTSNGQFQPNGPFSMTQIVTIVHQNAGITSFDASDHTAVPEPATMLLLGSGLLGLGVFARKKFHRA